MRMPSGQAALLRCDDCCGASTCTRRSKENCSLFADHASCELRDLYTWKEKITVRVRSLGVGVLTGEHAIVALGVSGVQLLRLSSI